MSYLKKKLGKVTKVDFQKESQEPIIFKLPNRKKEKLKNSKSNNQMIWKCGSLMLLVNLIKWSLFSAEELSQMKMRLKSLILKLAISKNESASRNKKKKSWINFLKKEDLAKITKALMQIAKTKIRTMKNKRKTISICQITKKTHKGTGLIARFLLSKDTRK